MNKFLYLFGRGLQLTALLALPSSIWTAEFYHSEALAIGILCISIFAFAIGYFLTGPLTKL